MWTLLCDADFFVQFRVSDQARSCPQPALRDKTRSAGHEANAVRIIPKPTFASTPGSRPRVQFLNASLSELNSVQALFLLRVAENSPTQVDSGVRFSVRQGNPITMPGLSTLGSYAFLPNTSRTIGAKNDRSSVGKSGSKDD